MRIFALALTLLFSASALGTTAPRVAGTALKHGSQTAWKSKLETALPLLGHRNWILIVDSAYPLQTSPGIETIETNADQIEVLRSVLASIHDSIQVRPFVFLDSELAFVPESDSPGVSSYRAAIAPLLSSYKLEVLAHEKIISNIDEAGKTFHILVLKTNMTIPYTSVFIRLDCKYWSDDSEKKLRTLMAVPPPR